MKPDNGLLYPQNCEQLIGTVEDTGGIMREIRELEDQVSVIYLILERQTDLSINLGGAI